MILCQTGESSVGFSYLKGVSVPKLGLLDKEVKNPGALVDHALGFQFGSCQEPSLLTDLDLRWASTIALSLILKNS